MTGADWVIVAFILLSVVLAAVQGFFFELFSMAGVVVGYLFAVWQYDRVAAWFEQYLKSVWVSEILGFLIIFVAVLVLAGILGRVVRKIVKEAGLSTFDRFLGAVFGLVRGSLMVSMLLLAQASFAPASQWLVGSELAPYFLVVGRAEIWLAPAALRARFYQGLDLLRQARQHGAPPATGSGK
jgi:membrane protein required for colicin V production